MNADGSDRRRITFSRGDEFSPAWSPDGHHLVFTRIVDDSTCDGFLYCGEEIFTINADGSEERRLTFNTTFDNSPVWSPDGAKIALSRYERGSCVNFQCDYDIFTMNPDGSDEVNLTHNDEANHGPDWSPDGSQIAFSPTKNACCVGEIYKMNADGSDMKQLTFQSPSRGDWIISGSPAWSPDGTKIAFTADFAGLNHSEIQVINSDGSGVKRLTDSPGVKFGPDWQPLNRPPDCSGVTADPSVLWPPNRQFRVVRLAGASDPDGNSVSIEISGVTEDEPVGGSRDAFGAANLVRLRAERDPHGDGRVYQVGFTATDSRGAQCSGTAMVGVPHNRGGLPVDSAPPSYDSFGG